MLALLAFGCLSGPAQAESSSGLQYQDAPPTVTGETVPNDRDPSAGSSNTPSGGGGDSTGSGSQGGSPAGGSSPGSGSAAGKAAGDAAQQQGSQGKDFNGSVGPGKTLQSESTPASSQEDDGTSPLVPILIAILVLAAISVGAVVYRRRRSAGSTSSGSPVSPEAG